MTIWILCYIIYLNEYSIFQQHTGKENLTCPLFWDQDKFLLFLYNVDLEARVDVAYATFIPNRFFSPLIFIKCLKCTLNSLLPLNFMIPWGAAVNIPVLQTRKLELCASQVTWLARASAVTQPLHVLSYSQEYLEFVGGFSFQFTYYQFMML